MCLASMLYKSNFKSEVLLLFSWRERDRQERERDSDWRRHRKSPSPDRKNPAERSSVQNSLSRDEPPPKKKKEELDPILTRTGGAYIPPAKLRMMQAQITDKNRWVKCKRIKQLVLVDKE